jgi:hypothetical protein
MSEARHHDEWLSIVPVSVQFLDLQYKTKAD